MLATILTEAATEQYSYGNVITAGYLVAALFFIMTLSGLSNQESAKKGNWYGVIGMAFGITLACVDAWHTSSLKGTNFTYILGTIVLMMTPGACIGIYVARRVVMTAMPELIACLHSFVGLAATLIGFGTFFEDEIIEGTFALGLHRVECYLGIFIGGLTFTGSLVAFGKLNGKVTSKPMMLGGKYHNWVNGGLLSVGIICMCLYTYGISWTADLTNLSIGTGLSLTIGVTMIMAIGGADMPVVISMLNSYSGWATAMAGLMLNNMVMVVTGALVGSSGAILSYIMCRAMNRSFISVILGGFGEGVSAPKQAAVEGEQKEISVKDAASLMSKSKSIIICPGYGMAAGKAQHAVAAITKLMRKHNCNLRFAVHPVAGRLPGHMNVLLAEARVPYDIVLEMDHINPDFPNTDLAIVLGANDTVNPAALDDPSSPIAGMPVIQCWKAKNVIVIKRGKGTGYAGVENPLFFKENTRMLFGNALGVCEKLLADLNTIYGDGTTEAAAPKPVVDEKTPLKQETKPGYQTKEVYPDPVHFVGVPKEVEEDECRVAATPESVLWLRKMAFGVYIESGAGLRSNFSDQDYINAGAHICANAEELYKKAEIVIKVLPPTIHPTYKKHECALMRKETVVISYLYPARNKDVMVEMEKAGVTAIAMDKIPRISRAQKCDVLSSMAGITGYRAVIEAASYFPRYMTGQITAAGTVKPAKILIVGAGVAGLASIGAGKGLGAIVRAFDSRSVVREQIESMGGEFLTIDINEEGGTASGYSKTMSEEYVKSEIALFTEQAKDVDVIITTAQIPDKKAPVLITEEAVANMKAGSVIVDLAAETGGNCALTQKGKTIETSNGVKIVGNTDLVSKMATQASTLYSNNICHLLDEMGKGTNFTIDEKNEIIYGCLCVIQGKIRWDPNRKPIAVTAPKAAAPKAEAAKAAAPKAAAPAPATESLHAPSAAQKKSKGWFFYFKWSLFVVFVVGIMGLALFMTKEMITLIVIFVFAIFIGYMVIWNVTPSLHTPLMSVTNAVSGIIVCGGIVQMTSKFLGPCFILGSLSTFLAAINVFGGFIVTHRMLQMFVLEKNQQ